MKRIIGLLHAGRVADWYYLCGIALTGVCYAGLPSFPRAGLILLSAALYLAHGYTLNDYFDLTYKPGKSRAARTTAGTLAILSLVINIPVSLMLGTPVLLIIIAGSILGYLYVAPPLRLKRYIAANFLLNSAGFALLFLLGIQGTGAPASVIASAPAAGFIGLLFIAFQSVHHLAHQQEDRAANAANLYLSFDDITASRITCGVFWGIAAAAFLVPLSFPARAVFIPATLLFCAASVATLTRLRRNEVPGTALRHEVRLLAGCYGIALISAFLLNSLH